MTTYKHFFKSSLIAGAMVGSGSMIQLNATDAFSSTELGTGSEIRSFLTGKQLAEITNLGIELSCGSKDTTSKTKEAKCGEGKCGEGKAGKKADKKAESKADKKDAKKSDDKTKEAKCGEGKCGNA